MIATLSGSIMLAPEDTTLDRPRDSYSIHGLRSEVKLPHAHQALVEQEKITGYLLDSDHRYGASKARYFTGLGFRRDAWEVLAAALREHGQRNEVARVRNTGYGPRYEVDGILRVPENRRAHVRTIWQIDEGHVVPRLITAHPLGADE